LDIYYINLVRRTDRRAFMEEQFARLGLTAARIEAVTPADIGPKERAAHCDARRANWLTPGALSCTLSHLRAMEAMRASAAPYALILEDDAVLSTGLPAVLEAFDRAPPALDVFRVETALKRLRTKAEGPPLAGVEVTRFVGWEGGSAAYVVTRRGADTITRSPRTKTRFFDQLFFYSSDPLARDLVVRQSNPGLAIQTQCLPAHSPVGRLSSDLDMAAFERQQEAPYYWRHALKRRAFAIHRDTILAAHKAWFLYAEGAKKHVIPFLD
jgi:glycosyl transferase, family 25